MINLGIRELKKNRGEIIMGRELKFRFWNTTCDKLVYLEQYKLGDMNGQLSFADLFNDNRGWTWEQYTGLKDKNGKEIYEGDIIRYKVLRDDCSTRHGYKYREVIESVKYDNEYGMYTTGPYSHLGTIANHYEPEIIGNIHEDGKLLKEK